MELVVREVPPSPETTPPTRAAVSWALYDLANTIFVFSILAVYFPLWVVDDMGGSDSTYGLANSLSMALIFLSAPIIGTLSDQVPRRLPFLALATLVCCACTGLIGAVGLIPSLALFVIANYAFQAGVIFYDTLLPVVSTEENRGWVGGVGVGLGFLGSLIALGMGAIVLQRFGEDADPLVFKLTAGLFLLFALPCILWVPEHRRADAHRVGWATVRQTASELRATISRARRYHGLVRFLIGRVFYADAANTLVAFVGIYATKELGFSASQVRVLIGISVLSAALGGFAWGKVVDRLGPKRTLTQVLWLWAAVLLLSASIAYLRLPKDLFWSVAPASGIAYAGLAAADRPLMFRISPPRYVGQLYGIFAMVGRFAAIIGPLLWAAIVDGLHLGRPAAIVSLFGMIVIAYVILRPLTDRRRRWAPDEMLPSP